MYKNSVCNIIVKHIFDTLSHGIAFVNEKVISIFSQFHIFPSAECYILAIDKWQTVRYEVQVNNVHLINII